MDFELHPVRQPGAAGQPRQAHGLGGVHRAAGVGQQEIARRVDEFEDVRVRVFLARKVRAAQGDGHQPRAAGVEGVAHRLVGGNFPVPTSRRDRNSRPAMTSGEPLCMARATIRSGHEQGKSGNHAPRRPNPLTYGIQTIGPLGLQGAGAQPRDGNLRRRRRTLQGVGLHGCRRGDAAGGHLPGSGAEHVRLRRRVLGRHGGRNPRAGDQGPARST